MSRFSRIAVAILCCLHLCGGHWGALQVVAWTKMIVDYSAQDGLVTGAAKTFDGAHPCCMCKAIAEGKKQESKDSKDGKTAPVVQSLLLKECLPAKLLEAPLPASCDAVLVSLLEPDLRGDWIGYRPPVPPPRFVA